MSDVQIVHKFAGWMTLTQIIRHWISYKR